MPIPSHYRSFYVRFIKFSLIMLVFGGFAGVLFQEMTGKIKFAELAPGVHLEALYRLALVHGHSFLIGAVMPIVWIAILEVCRKLGCREVSEKSLAWVFWTYLTGCASVIGLLLYKGVHYVVCVKRGERDFDAIHASIFGGVRWLRAIAYASAHTIATIALVIFAVVIWRSLATRSRDEAGR